MVVNYLLLSCFLLGVVFACFLLPVLESTALGSLSLHYVYFSNACMQEFFGVFGLFV